MIGTDTVARVAEAFVDDVRAVRPFGGGHINETFLVSCSTSAYVVQRFNTAVFSDPDAVMHNIVTVHRHVHGHHLPEPLATRTGEWIARDASGAWRAWHLVEDAAPVSASSPGAAASAGELLGRFHAAIADLDAAALVETIPRFHEPARRLDALRTAIATGRRDRVVAARDEIDTLLSYARLADVAAEVQAGVPRRVAHNDAKLDNVLFRDGQAVCLVDLDTLMPGAWFWDTGDLLRSAATVHAEDDPRATVDPALHRAVLDGYRRGAVHVLERDELEALALAGAIVTFEQAVRFLTDWIEGDVYYKTSRPAQNLDRARAQLRLLASMPGTVPYS